MAAAIDSATNMLNESEVIFIEPEATFKYNSKGNKLPKRTPLIKENYSNLKTTLKESNKHNNPSIKEQE